MSPADFIARPVIPLLIFFMTGIITGHFIRNLSVFPILGAFFCLLLVIRSASTGKRSIIPPLLLFALLGFLLIQKPCGFEKNLESENHILFYTEREEVVLTGTVDEEPRLEKRDQTFTINGITVADDLKGAISAQGRLRIRAALSGDMFEKGDTVYLSGKIKKLRNYSNPGGFDYKAYMENNDVWGNMYVKKGDSYLVSRGKPSAIDRVRKYVETSINGIPGSDDAKSVLKALVTGNRKEISDTLRDDFARTGTAHLLAISGLHVGMVAGFSFAVFYFFLSFIPGVLWQGRIKTWVGIMTLLPVWFYAVMAGMSPSTQRAAIMATVVLLTYGFLAEQDIMNTLFIAALVILSIFPASLFLVSFQLSFASVFFIIWGMGLLKKKQDKNNGQSTENHKGIIWKFAGYMAVSFFAFAGTWPIVSYYFNQISVVGFIANAILIPMVGMVVVPLGLTAALLCGFTDFFSFHIMTLAGFVADCSVSTISFFSSFSWAAVKTVTPSITEMACYYILLFCIIGLVKNRKNKLQRNFMTTVAVIALSVLFIDGVYWIKHRYFHKDLRVTCLDVGQGSSALVEFPGGRTMLIDGGGFSDNSMFDVGEKLVAPFLWSKKIAHVNTVVLSHPESDHLNGLLYILENFKVDELWTNGIERKTSGFLKMMELVELNKVRLVTRDDLEDFIRFGDVDVHVFWPLKSTETDRFFYSKNVNNMSIVLKLTLGERSFLFPGDILELAETAMINYIEDEGLLLKSDILIVPHHGSKSSSSQRFIDTVNPDIAVISLGYKNRFRFPHPSVVERLEGAGSVIYRTDSDGAVTLSTDGQGLKIKTVLERTSEGNSNT